MHFEINKKYKLLLTNGEVVKSFYNGIYNSEQHGELNWFTHGFYPNNMIESYELITSKKTASKNPKICVRCGGSGKYRNHGNCYLCGGIGHK